MATNDIDLFYFSNTYGLKKIAEKEEQKKDIINKEDKKFYKKRIIQLTKDLLKGKGDNNIINASFNAYIKTAIEHFKFIDKKEIIRRI